MNLKHPKIWMATLAVAGLLVAPMGNMQNCQTMDAGQSLLEKGTTVSWEGLAHLGPHGPHTHQDHGQQAHLGPHGSHTHQDHGQQAQQNAPAAPSPAKPEANSPQPHHPATPQTLPVEESQDSESSPECSFCLSFHFLPVPAPSLLLLSQGQVLPLSTLPQAVPRQLLFALVENRGPPALTCV